jgi:uncharacterized protein (UPF0548 family)
VAEWRLGRRWSEDELLDRLAALPTLARNFNEPGASPTRVEEWRRHASTSRIAQAPAGVPRPGGAFELARDALRAYAFSDPSIVEAHFDPAHRLEGRHLLLELKVAVLRYLCGTRIASVEDRQDSGSSTFGFRYDTLEGHVERGYEWFRIEQDHATGEVTFCVEARWLPGDFPNWWSRLGFAVVAPLYQRRWHRRAHRRMAAFAEGRRLDRPFSRREMAHQGPEVAFTRAAPGSAP